MPELPEVETVRRELAKSLPNKVLLRPAIYFAKMIQTDFDEYRNIDHLKVMDVTRQGKFLILHLSNQKKLLFHLRMEGKLYLVNKEHHDLHHLSLFFPFDDDENGLAFYDVRKFGVTYYLDEKEMGPLQEVGPEPKEVKDTQKLWTVYRTKRKPIKDLLMDQTIMSGLGNIYANEVCYACSLSPFMNSESLTLEQTKQILQESIRILTLAIKYHGSTIRTYHATQDTSGSFQDLIQVYGKEGQVCPKCHRFKIERRGLSGRGTYFCPHCQHTGISVAITGKIASGKSLAASYFEMLGFVRFSADEEVHKLYHDEKFKQKLKDRFPNIFENRFSKSRITKLLQTSDKFRREYENVIFKEVKLRMNRFFIENDGKNKVFEIPLLFDAHMEKDFTYLVGTETTRQEEHLAERGEDIRRQSFNQLNSYDKHRHQLDFILQTDGTKAELKNKVIELVKKITCKE